jgi:hypothetical protein
LAAPLRIFRVLGGAEFHLFRGTASATALPTPGNALCAASLLGDDGAGAATTHHSHIEESEMRREFEIAAAIGFAFAVACGAPAFADSVNSDIRQDQNQMNMEKKDIHQDQKTIQNEKKDIRRDQQALRRDERDGDKSGAAAMQKDITQDKSTLKGEEKDVRQDRHELHNDMQDTAKDRQDD